MGGFWSALKRAFGGSGYTYLSAVDDGPRMRSGPATEAPGVDDAVHVTLADLTKKYTELYDAMNLKRGDFTRGALDGNAGPARRHIEVRAGVHGGASGAPG